MARWDMPGVPHKGWTLVGFEDIKDDPDADYETCEMCGNERIRFVHILSHPDYSGLMRVGCNCAEKMTDDYTTHREHESYMQKRAARRRNFLKQEWVRNLKGNWILHYKGDRITAIERNGGYGFVYHNRWVWDYKGKRIRDLETLKLAAFEVFDKEYE